LGTFAVVHGAWHGSWRWERLTPLLEELGHRVVVVDLPSEDPTATFETDADVVVMALAQRASMTPSWSALARRTAD
jgi:pimeloyl-ACP methyl ester carboxylesterase